MMSHTAPKCGHPASSDRAIRIATSIVHRAEFRVPNTGPHFDSKDPPLRVVRGPDSKRNFATFL